MLLQYKIKMSEIFTSDRQSKYLFSLIINVNGYKGTRTNKILLIATLNLLDYLDIYKLDLITNYQPQQKITKHKN